MNVLQAAVLGVIQGLTEFLPVSSTAHLRIVPALIGWPDPGAAFTAVVQLGTMLAILLYFWREIVHISVAWARGFADREVRSSLECRIGWYVLFATIPIGLFGLLFANQIENGARNLWLIASALIVLGLVLLAADRNGTRDRVEEQIRLRDGLTVGLAQAVALVPGVSRSGSTITAGLFVGLERQAAARFSFLLSVPAVVLSGLFELRKVGGHGGPGIAVTVLATILAFVVGLASIHWLLRFLTQHSTAVFVGYRVGLGCLLLLLLGTGLLTAT
ncbi:MAG TPA: undecaprenyl-diphosphate phosphatase [Mycobacteriales bacterium]|nr:undecaprenyl-diphosphate phosphatase [Mycobacteriales bacterium]